jgi:hypothetical protein
MMASTACADSVDRSASVYCVFLHTALCATQTESSNVLHILSFYAEVCLFLCVCVCVCARARTRTDVHVLGFILSAKRV